MRKKFTFEINTETGAYLSIKAISTKDELKFPYALSSPDDEEGLVLDVQVGTFTESMDCTIENSIRVEAFDLVVMNKAGDEIVRRHYKTGTWFDPPEILNRITGMITGSMWPDGTGGQCRLLNDIRRLRSTPFANVYDTKGDVTGKCAKLTAQAESCTTELLALLEDYPFALPLPEEDEANIEKVFVAMRKIAIISDITFILPDQPKS